MHLVDLVAARSCRGCGVPGPMLCASCAASLPPPADAVRPSGVDRVLAGSSYEGAMRSLILDLKLRGLRRAAAPLADVVASVGRREGVYGEAITWVPGRPREARVRGFDHAEAIARSLAGFWGLPVLSLLRRVADTRDQTHLGRAEREANMKGAFEGRKEVAGLKVVLVDDLVTTGATASVCAAALRTSGAVGVEVAVPCRAS